MSRNFDQRLYRTLYRTLAWNGGYLKTITMQAYGPNRLPHVVHGTQVYCTRVKHLSSKLSNPLCLSAASSWQENTFWPFAKSVPLRHCHTTAQMFFSRMPVAAAYPSIHAHVGRFRHHRPCPCQIAIHHRTDCPPHRRCRSPSPAALLARLAEKSRRSPYVSPSLPTPE